MRLCGHWEGSARWWSLDLSSKTRGFVPTIGLGLASPGRGGVLERRVRRIVEAQIQEKQCGFHPGRETAALYVSRVLEGALQFARPVHKPFAKFKKKFPGSMFLRTPSSQTLTDNL